MKLLLGGRTKVDDNDVVVANAAQTLENLSEWSNDHVLRRNSVFKPLQIRP